MTTDRRRWAVLAVGLGLLGVGALVLATDESDDDDGTVERPAASTLDIEEVPTSLDPPWRFVSTDGPRCRDRRDLGHHCGELATIAQRVVDAVDDLPQAEPPPLTSDADGVLRWTAVYDLPDETFDPCRGMDIPYGARDAQVQPDTGDGRLHVLGRGSLVAYELVVDCTPLEPDGWRVQADLVGYRVADPLGVDLEGDPTTPPPPALAALEPRVGRP
jgi:hypothetical protein